MRCFKVSGPQKWVMKLSLCSSATEGSRAGFVRAPGFYKGFRVQGARSPGSDSLPGQASHCANLDNRVSACFPVEQHHCEQDLRFSGGFAEECGV